MTVQGHVRTAMVKIIPLRSPHSSVNSHLYRAGCIASTFGNACEILHSSSSYHQDIMLKLFANMPPKASSHNNAKSLDVQLELKRFLTNKEKTVLLVSKDIKNHARDN